MTEMDDCLHEITHIRNDLPSLLQLRPRPIKGSSFFSPSSSSWTRKKARGRMQKAGASRNRMEARKANLNDLSGSLSCRHRVAANNFV